MSSKILIAASLFAVVALVQGCNRADQLIEEALERRNGGDPAAAVPLLEKALSLRRQAGDAKGEALALKELGNTYQILGEHRRAIELQRQCLEIAETIKDSDLQARALVNLGISLHALGLDDQALSYARRSLEIALKEDNPAVATIAHWAIGSLFLAQGKSAEAIGSFKASVDAARRAGDQSHVSSGLAYLGLAYSNQGKRAEAIASYREALDLARKLKNLHGEADILNGLAHELNESGDWQEAAELFQKALSTGQEIKDRNVQIASLRGLSLSHLARSDYPQLIQVSQQLRSLAKSEADLVQEEAAVANLARAYTGLNQHEKAAEAYRDLLVLAKKNQNPKNVAEAQQALGDAASLRGSRVDLTGGIDNLDRKTEARVLAMLAADHFREGDFAKALHTAEQARAIAVETQEDEAAALALGVLGPASAALMDDAAAIRWSEEAVSLARRRNDFEAESYALQTLGSAYASRGDYVRAISSCREGLDQTKDDALAASFLRCLGISYVALQDPEQAIEYLQRALGAAQKLNDPKLESTILNALGHHYSLLDQGEKAAGYFQQSAQVQSKIGEPLTAAAAELSAASAQISRRNLRGAIPHLERALKLLDAIKEKPALAVLRSSLWATSMGTLASCYAATGENGKGLSYAERAWETRKSSTNPTDLAEALHDLGHAQFLAGRRHDAEKTLQTAITEWERARKGLGENQSLEKALILNHQMETYERLQQVLVTEGRPERALEIAERGRARALVEAVAARTGSAPAEPSIGAFQRLAREKNLTLVEYSILYDPNGILPYSRFNDRQSSSETDLFIWVLKPTGEIVFRKVDLKSFRERTGGSLAGTVRGLRGSVGGRGRTRGVARAGTDEFRQLYDLLIAPIAGHLPANPEARVVFVPQGPLFLVPFAALRDPSGKYLVEKHTVLWAPSIDALVSAPRRAIRPDWKSDEILAVGNPAIAAELKLDPYNLADLPHAGEEAVSISRSLGAQALTRDRAGKEEVLRLLPRRRLLHFATHGLLEGFGDPLIPGALLLAPSKDDNGLLTAREILDLNLQADLAVLSACDTARGRITSDGVIGLSRALMSAGTPNVVVSLWSVPDAPTSFLMQRFYAELKSKPDPGRALRQAMLATMKKSPLPKDWAAFTLIGGVQ